MPNLHKETLVYPTETPYQSDMDK